MGAITVTPELVSLLSPLKERTEIRDAQGQVVGIFTPQAVAEEERLGSMFDLEEAERILATQRDAGRPLKEFWSEMEARRTSG